MNDEKMKKMEDQARTIAKMLDVMLNGEEGEKKMGFGLVLFSFTGPELTWISNAERENMAKALTELQARWLSELLKQRRLQNGEESIGTSGGTQTTLRRTHRAK